VSKRDDSSSLLPIGAAQIAAFPGTAEAREEVVLVHRLEDHLRPDRVRRPCLLKIDVQGFELYVLKGAGETLDLVDEILVEASFVELYDGQPLAHEIVNYLGERGFRLADISSVSRQRGGRALQAEFLFRRG
jgi:hypothetical protein